VGSRAPAVLRSELRLAESKSLRENDLQRSARELERANQNPNQCLPALSPRGGIGGLVEPALREAGERQVPHCRPRDEGSQLLRNGHLVAGIRRDGSPRPDHQLAHRDARLRRTAGCKRFGDRRTPGIHRRPRTTAKDHAARADRRGSRASRTSTSAAVEICWRAWHPRRTPTSAFGSTSGALVGEPGSWIRSWLAGVGAFSPARRRSSSIPPRKVSGPSWSTEAPRIGRICWSQTWTRQTSSPASAFPRPEGRVTSPDLSWTSEALAVRLDPQTLEDRAKERRPPQPSTELG